MKDKREDVRWKVGKVLTYVETGAWLKSNEKKNKKGSCCFLFKSWVSSVYLMHFLVTLTA